MIYSQAELLTSLSLPLSIYLSRRAENEGELKGRKFEGETFL